ncbi:MAG: hypothetical protein KAV87_30575 [Desulfobacteraceae bacterium]|nr:hypothetical protein [Desulfobacteraceae bacterium]
MKRLLFFVVFIFVIGACNTSFGAYYYDENDIQTYNKSGASVTLTTAECSNTVITNYGWNGTASDQTFTFCTAVANLKTKFLNCVTHATADIYLDPSDNVTQTVLDGTACGDDERVWTDNATKYESITCHTFTEDGTNYDWACDSINGAWLDKGS